MCRGAARLSMACCSTVQGQRQASNSSAAAAPADSHMTPQARTHMPPRPALLSEHGRAGFCGRPEAGITRHTHQLAEFGTAGGPGQAAAWPSELGRST